MVVRPKRSMAPVRSIDLALKPFENPWLSREVLFPESCPLCADHLWVRRQSVHPDHLKRIFEQFIAAERAAIVVHVVRVAVVRGIGRDDRLQRWGSEHCNLY